MSKILNVLLVEDSEADRRLVEEALLDCRVQVNLKSLTDGEQAIKYLKRIDPFQNADRPDLIILDLNMPRKDGHEFLEEMASHLEENEIPIVLLTVSDTRADIDRAQNARLNFYLPKPVNAEKLHKVLAAVNELWAGPIGMR